MKLKTNHIFTRQEAALAYALSAERLFGDDEFLNQNPAVIPIFVSQLFQSLEISIKHAGIEAKLFTDKEARDLKSTCKGHGIKELAMIAVKKLGGKPFGPIITAMTYFSTTQNASEIISLMISGSKFGKTRECYASRCLGYAEVRNGDFALIDDIPLWIASVKETANNLPKTIGILKQWKASKSQSQHFAIWLQGRNLLGVKK